MTASLAPISLPIAFDGDRMVVTNPVSNRRLHRKRLSPSTAKAMEGCPARYAAEKLMPGLEDPFGAAPVGTSGHAVMEALMQQLPADRTQQRAEELLITELLNEAAPRPKDGWPGILATRGAEWLTSVRAAFSGLFGIEDPAEVDVFSTEMHLDTAEVAGVPFVGYIDRVERITSRSGADRFRVVDYKTAKKLPWTPRGQINAHEDQLRAYILAFADSLQVPTSHVSAAIYYTRDKVAKAKAVPAPKSRLDDTARRFNRSWVDLKSYCSEAAWPCVSSPLCGWCPLVSVCPVAKADGKVAKLDGLPVAEQFDVPVLRPLDAVSYLADAQLRAQAKLSKPPESTPDLAHLEALADQWGARNSPVLQLPASSEPDVSEPEPDPADDPAESSAGAVVQLGDGRVETATDLDPEGVSSTDSSGSGGMRPYAAHVSGKDRETVNDARGDTTMATNFLHDDKPWEEVSGPSSTLNPNSYSAQAAFGIVEIAVESLHDAGFALRPSVVSELSQTLAAVVARVQLALTGRTSMQEGMNARLRGALRTALKTLPCPVGASSEELHDWVEKITRRTNSVAAAAIALWDAGDPEVPEQFTALAGLRRIAAA